MSVKKTIKEQFDPLYVGFNRVANELRDEIKFSLVDFSNKLDAQKVPKWYALATRVRNWVTHILVWFIFAFLLSSCFVSGRTIHIATPRVEVSADTATAFTLPYKSNNITY